MKKIFISGLILLASGGFAFAQSDQDFLKAPDNSAFTSVNYSNTPTKSTGSSSSGGVTDLKSLINFVIDYINEGIYVLMAVATIAFVYNIVMYFVVKTDGDRTEASKYLIWSVIGLAVIVSFWGIVNVVIKTFSLNNSQPDVKNIYFKR